jgi:hypothetical protein
MSFLPSTSDTADTDADLGYDNMAALTIYR